MAKQTINIGTVANDGTGDPLRTAMNKVNENFTEVYTSGGPSHTQSITTITSVAAQTVAFANPIELNASTSKDFKLDPITSGTTINLTGATDGDGGFIEFIVGSSGHTITLGTMFTKNSGGGAIDTTINADNLIVWMRVGSDIIYSISQITQ